MRKWLSTFVLIGIFLSSITTSHASLDGIKLADFPYNSVLYQKARNEKGLNYLKNIIILPYENFNQKETENIVGRLDSLPVSLLQKINEKGIYVKLFNGKLTDNPTASYLKGEIPRGYHTTTTWDDVPGMGGSRTVLVKIGSSDKGKGHGSINLELHELAHSIDRLVYHDIRYDHHFQAVWKRESESLFPGNSYFINYPEEYFAETFAMFYYDQVSRNVLKEKAPLTYKLISRLS
ncbi:toxin [Neobacillus sp. PS3-34]|uniref:anthrax toxin lethal factor-related metalloendopeptidase n=1 Tax=Neobacillus sp. PS3-34 TaxID=3070678 RepID=UPI0027DF00BD|nr:toxin [Neobacillus sp. PS3-34]WML47786.1 toxin [Neobacillus sp. PS3-34]